MARQGPRKSVDGTFWNGRLTVAQAFKKAAEEGLTLHIVGDAANPICSNAVDSAIAYCDAVTGCKGGVVNQQNHADAVKLLREVMGNTLPKGRENNLRNILQIRTRLLTAPERSPGTKRRRWSNNSRNSRTGQKASSEGKGGRGLQVLARECR